MQGANNTVPKRTLTSTLYFGDEPSSPYRITRTFLSPLKLLAEQGFEAIALIKCLRPLKHLTAMQGPPGKAGTPPPYPHWGHNACRLCGLLCFGADEPAAFPSSCLVGSVMLTGSSRAERVVFITCSLLTKLSQAYSSPLQARSPAAQGDSDS